MRNLLVLTFCCLFNLAAVAQSDSSEVDNEFIEIAVYAQFPGGEDSFSRYVSENVVYPTIAKDKGLEARVIIKFAIDSAGSVSDTKVIYTSINSDRNLEDVYGFGQELERVVLNSPKWKPAMQRDKPVSIRMRFTYKFEL